MKKAFTGLILGLCCWAVAAASLAETKYAVCVGINTYKEISSLKGCVNDANYFYTNLVARGGWQKSNMTRLTNSGATKDAIRKAISNYAAKAVSGDVFVYQHSSHGGQFNATDDDEYALTGEEGKDTFLCVYDEIYADNTTAYNDYEMAVDFASFKDGVKVVVIVDACHSGGLFKSKAAARASADSFDLAGRVTALMEADRAQRRARGENVAKTLSPSQIGWVTAAEYYEYSLDGGYYDSDKWLTSSSKGKVMGGVFLGAFTWSWWNGTCDTKSGYGDNDQYADAYECWRVAYEHCTKLSSDEAFTPQFLNKDVLRSVELGWVGDEEPSGVRFANIPAQSVTVGQTLSYTLVAANSDGSTGAIQYSIASSSAPSGSYSLDENSGAFTFTPAADGLFTFDFVGTNASARTSGKATMTVTATLPAPENLSNSGVTASSFTANWDAVPGAKSYLVDVATDESFSRGSGGELVNEGFADGTKLPAGWTVESGSLGGTYEANSTGNYGNAAPSLKLANTVTFSTPTLSNPTEISFWYKGNGSGFSSTLVVQQLVGGNWEDVSGVEISTKAATFSHALDPAATQVRFVFTKNSGNVAFDDVMITGAAGDSTLVVDEESVSSTSFTAEALETDTYFWRVRAVGNAKGPFSATEEVTLVADPNAPPSIRAIDDIEIEVGETATAIVKVSAPVENPVTSLSITAGDAAAKLGEDGVFSFAPEAAGVYPFTITAVNAKGSAEASFTVTATLAEPETPEVPADVSSDYFTAEWKSVPGAEFYELVVIEGKGGSSGGGGGGSGETLTETFAKASFSTAGGSYANQTISGGDLGTWTATQCRGDQGGVPTVGGTGTLASPEFADGVSGVEFDYSWPFTSDTMSGDIDLYVGGFKVASASVTGGTAGTASYSFSPVSGATSIEFVNTYATAKKLRISFNEIRITTASGKSIAKAVGDVVYSNNVGNVTSFKVTGLQPLTEYAFSFRAIAGEEATEWSAPVSVTTADGPAAPAWTAIPAQTASIGYPFSIDLSAYVSGVPTPSIALTAGTAELSGTILSFTPAAAGEYSFTVTASNSSGDPAEASFTVTAVEHVPTKYAVCVGINEYADINGLEGCVNDSMYMESNLIERGGWAAENVVRLNDKNATKAAIRKAIADVAAKAQAGDTFVYQHSSHGGQFNATEDDEDPLTGEEGKATFLCVYDEIFDDNTTAYNDYEIAADMAAFNAGVKVAVIVDACHSGGLFKSKEAARASAASFDLAGRVTALMDADRAARRARGENVAKTLSSSEIGWATAAEYYEYSYDGGFYHTDEWLTNNVYGDEYYDEDYQEYNYPSSYKQGGVFLASATWSWWNGTGDADGDGLCDAYEFWQRGYDFCSVVGEFWYEDATYNYYPQCTNVAVLKSIELGWIKDPRLPAPENPQATEPTASSFVASWNAVEDAVSYNLYLQKKVEDPKAVEQEYLIDESFEDGEIPAGWTASSGISVASGKNGDGDYCVAFKAAGANLITPAVENPTGISFQYKRSGNTTPWSLEVAVGASPDGPWTTVGEKVNDASTEWSTFAADMDASGAQYIKFTDTRSTGGAERYIDLVQITGSAGTWVDVEGYAPVNVAGTSKEITGLESGTDYRYTVRAVDAEGVESADSERVTVTTAEEDTAPVWSEIPEQSAVVGQEFSIDLTAFVSGSPAPSITVDGAAVAGGVFAFTPDAEGPQTFALVASNDLGSDDATLTVNVAAAPVTVPTLALSNPQATSFDASWTACTGVSSYTLQVATDDQFTTGSAAGTVELFSNPANSATAPEGWTYDISSKTGKYLVLDDAAQSVVSPAVSTKGMASLTIAFKSRTYGGTGAGLALVEYSTDGGSTWAEAGTAEAANTTMSSRTIDAAKCIGLDSVKFRWTAPNATGSKGIGIQDLLLSGEGSGGDGSLVKELTVEGTSTTVDGLEPETLYYARVKGAAEWSEVKSIKTEADVPTKPAWLAIPEQTATVGQEFVLDLSAFITGSPFPTITVDGVEAVAGNWSFTPEAAGEFTFELVATNTEGSDSTTLTVVVSEAPPAPVTVPELTLSNATETSFDAAWTECTDATGYQLQVATDDQFTTGGTGEATELFNNAAQTADAPEGWTYAIDSASGKYLHLVSPDNSIVSPAVSTKGFASLSLDFRIRTFGGSGAPTAVLAYSTDGETWTNLGTATATTNSLKAVSVDATACIGLDSVQFRWTCPDSTGSVGVGVDKLVLSGAGAGEGGSIILDESTSGLDFTVTGLTPETTYYVRVRMAGGEWSEVQSVTTAAAGGEPVEVDIAEVTIAAGNLSFAVPAGATVMTTGDLVNGPWVEYTGEIVDGQVVIPMTGDPAFFRIGNPPAGN